MKQTLQSLREQFTNIPTPVLEQALVFLNDQSKEKQVLNGLRELNNELESPSEEARNNKAAMENFAIKWKNQINKHERFDAEESDATSEKIILSNIENKIS